jgi:clathrin heavy chain
MAQKQPVKLQELAKLGAAGIKPEDLNFKSVTMDSGKFLCIRETAAKNIAIIDTTNPSNIQRMPAPVELACVHPDGGKLVLAAQQQVQIYNVASKEKIQACALPEAAVFTKWVDESTLGIVTGTAVFHWGLGGKQTFALCVPCALCPVSIAGWVEGVGAAERPSD